MKLFGLDINLTRDEIVVIWSAEQTGVVMDVRLDSQAQAIEYLVAFRHGSVFIEDAADYDCYMDITGTYEGCYAWFCEWELRRLP